MFFIQSALWEDKNLGVSGSKTYLCTINHYNYKQPNDYDMTLILHNLKVAVRNLVKYKLQTLISVLSIAIGIVTFSLAHSALSKYQLPPISSESYFDRAYMVMFEPMNNIGFDKINETRQYFPTMQPEETKIDIDMIRALKGNGALKNAENNNRLHSDPPRPAARPLQNYFQRLNWP